MQAMQKKKKKHLIKYWRLRNITNESIYETLILLLRRAVKCLVMFINISRKYINKPKQTVVQKRKLTNNDYYYIDFRLILIYLIMKPKIYFGQPHT